MEIIKANNCEIIINDENFELIEKIVMDCVFMDNKNDKIYDLLIIYDVKTTENINLISNRNNTKWFNIDVLNDKFELLHMITNANIWIKSRCIVIIMYKNELLECNRFDKWINNAEIILITIN